MYHDLSIWHTYMREHVYAFIKTISNQCFTIDIHIVLKPGPTRRVDPGQVDEKIGKVMTRQPGWPSKTRLQHVDFFLLKRRRFEFFFKIGIDSADPVTRSKPGTQALDRAGHWAGFRNYGYVPYCFIIQCLCYHHNIILCIHQNYMKSMFYYWHVTYYLINNINIQCLCYYQNIIKSAS